MKEFPSMPGSAAKLISMLDDPSVPIEKIEDALRYDPGLTANILKLSNSAYFGLSTEVGSVKRAVVLLGLKRVTQIVMTSCISAVMSSGIDGYDLPPGELWRHSIAVSVAAELLVKELKLPASEETFTAALLHDVGKMALGNHVKGRIQEIEAQITNGTPFQVAERRVLGTDHAEVGAQILKGWSLPEEIVNAVRRHHEPDHVENPQILDDIVHIADVLCLMIGIGVGREGLRYEPSPGSTKRLGVKNEHLELVASQTIQSVSDLSGMLEAV